MDDRIYLPRSIMAHITELRSFQKRSICCFSDLPLHPGWNPWCLHLSGWGGNLILPWENCLPRCCCDPARNLHVWRGESEHWLQATSCVVVPWETPQSLLGCSKKLQGRVKRTTTPTWELAWAAQDGSGRPLVIHWLLWSRTETNMNILCLLLLQLPIFSTLPFSFYPASFLKEP